MREFVHADQLKGHQAVVVGAGRSGIAATRLLLKLGAQVRLLEQGSKNIQSFEDDHLVQVIHGEHKAEYFLGAQLVVLSPGIAKSRVRSLIPQDVQVISELELASWFVSKPMIAITGTNGKTTTTTLVGRILEHSGHKAFVGGNIGTPLSEYLLDHDQAEVLVLEVSSFQLQNSPSFHPQVAVLLNFSPNHLDYHESMAEYLEAKLSMFARLDTRDLAIVPLAMRQELEGRNFTQASRTYFVGTNRFQCPGLPGAHNQENLEAAYLASRFFGVSVDEAQAAVRDFVSLPHRLETVLEYQGVIFVDDSKSTTIDSVLAAIKSQDRPIHLLAGGIFKGGDLRLILPVLQEKVRAIYLFGASREIFEEAWQDFDGSLTWDATLEAAVVRAATQAQTGDCVLLSPATASFDLFANYKERGRAFQQCVRQWAGEKSCG